MSKRVAVIGAGAVGGYTCGHMARNGVDVTFIDPWPEHVDAMNEKGLLLTGTTEQERFLVPVKAMHLTEVQNLAKQQPIDIAIISTKSYDTEWAAALIKQYMAPAGYFVSLQNCVNEERLAAVVGWGRTLGCIAASISCELVEPGHVMRTVPVWGDKHVVFRCGEVHGRTTPRAEELAQLLRFADNSKVTNNLWGERWSKLTVNSSHNGLSAATGYSGNDMCLVEEPRWLSIRLSAETIRVAKAHGVQLEKIKGHDPDTWVAAADGDKRALDAIVSSLVESAKTRSDEQRPSMGQDMAKGRRTEIDFLNGHVVEKGREAGVPTPLNAKMVELVTRVERGELKQGHDVIKGV